jgi:hypothetical protein
MTALAIISPSRVCLPHHAAVAGPAGVGDAGGHQPRHPHAALAQGHIAERIE